MHFIPRVLPRASIVPLLLVAGLLVAGCASDTPPRGARGRPPRMQAVPNLAGRETFFAGRIVAEVRIGALAGFDRSGNGEGGGSAGPGGRPRRGSGGSGGGFSMGGMGMGMGGPPEGGGPGRGPGGDDEGPRSHPRGNMGMNTPPVAIHLRFTNTGTAPTDLRIVDFLSPLGNFVVTPSQLKLEPGQSLEVEPMASRLAGEVTSGEISLNLRLGEESETKVVTLTAEAPRPPVGTP